MNAADILLLVLLFLLVCGIVATGAYWLGDRSRLRARIAQGASFAAAATGLPGGAAAPEPGVSGVDAHGDSALQRLATPAARLAGAGDAQSISRLQAHFLQAGLRARAAPMYFLALKTVLALGLPLLAWVALSVGGWRMEGARVPLMLVVAAAAGLYLPSLALRWRVARRQRALFEAFPAAIDLMIVCVEAGLSLDMAIQRAGQEMALRSPALAEELALVGTELRIGATRDRALRNLATRTGVPEVGAFVAALLQADRFGTAIADSMRVHAEDLRLRRQYRAEEAAARIPTQLLFPLVLTILPALFVVLVGPAAIGLARQVLPMMGGSGG
jgi:tight adherence protein C